MSNKIDEVSADSPLDEAIAAFFEAEAAGINPKPSEWIGRYPDLAEALARFFEDHQMLALMNESHFTDLPLAFGDYEIIKEIGRGGMGRVYLARQISLDRTVALKMTSIRSEPIENAYIRFRIEAEAIARLDDPGIVPIFDYGIANGAPYFSMKLVGRGSLADHLDEYAGDTRKGAQLTLSIARSIQHAHSRGILHRDLKPSNILLDGEKPLVSDFGLAKVLGSAHELTLSGELLGSPPYMAPEQAHGDASQIAIATDVYGIGAILYCVLTSRPPFRGTSIVETLDQVRNNEPVPPSRLNPKVDRDLETICLKCLEKEPSKRYFTAADLADELDRYLNGLPILARRTGLPRRVLKWAKRSPAIATLAMALSMALVTGFTGVLWQWRSAVLARDLMELNLYRSRIMIADQELDTGTPGMAIDYLNECPERLRNWEWGYLRRSRNYRVADVGEGVGVVTGLAYSPDGKRIAAASSRPPQLNLTLIDSDSGAAVWTKPAHMLGYAEVAYSSDGKYIATASATGTDTKLWNAETGDVVWTFKPNPISQVWSLLFSRDHRFLYVGADKDILVIDISNGSLVASWKGHASRVYGLAYHPKSSQIASCSEDGTIHLWDPSAGMSLRTIEEGSLLSLRGVTFSPDGKYLAAGTEAGAVVMWDTNIYAEVGRKYAHTQLVRNVVFHPSGKRFATGSTDGFVRVWDTDGMSRVLTLHKHPQVVAVVAFSPDGNELTVGTGDIGPAALRRYDASLDRPQTPDEATTFAGHTAPVTDLSYSADGKWIATCSHDKTVIVRDTTTGRVRARLTGPTGALMCVALRPDGTQVAASGWDKSVVLWDVVTGKILQKQTNPKRPVMALRYSSDGTKLIAGGHDKMVFIMDADDITKFQELGLRAGIADIAIDPTNRRYFFASTAENIARLHNLDTLKAEHFFPTVKGYIRAVAVSPDGNTLGVGGLESVRIWDVESRKPLLDLKPRGDIFSLAFNMDGRLIASGSADRLIQVWDASTGKLLKTLQDSTGIVRHIAFSPDGKHLAATGDDEKIRIWDIQPILNALPQTP